MNVIQIIGLIFFSIFVVFMLLVFFQGKKLSDHQGEILRLIASFMSAFGAGLLTYGTIQAQIATKVLTISATGAVAMWGITFYGWGRALSKKKPMN